MLLEAFAKCIRGGLVANTIGLETGRELDGAGGIGAGCWSQDRGADVC